MVCEMPASIYFLHQRTQAGAWPSTGLLCFFAERSFSSLLHLHAAHRESSSSHLNKKYPHFEKCIYFITVQCSTCSFKNGGRHTTGAPK